MCNPDMMKKLYKYEKYLLSLSKLEREQILANTLFLDTDGRELKFLNSFTQELVTTSQLYLTFKIILSIEKIVDVPLSRFEPLSDDMRVLKAHTRIL